MLQLPLTGTLFLAMLLTSNTYTLNNSASLLLDDPNLQNVQPLSNKNLNTFTKRYFRFKQNYLSPNGTLLLKNFSYVPNFYEILRTNIKHNISKYNLSIRDNGEVYFKPNYTINTYLVSKRRPRRRNRHRHSKRVKIMKPMDYLLPPRKNDFPELTISELQPLFEAYQHYKKILTEQYGMDPSSELGIDEKDFNDRFKNIRSDTLYRVIKNRNAEPPNILKPPVITITTTDYMFFVTPAGSNLTDLTIPSTTEVNYQTIKNQEQDLHSTVNGDVKTILPTEQPYNFSVTPDFYQPDTTTLPPYTGVIYENYSYYDEILQPKRNTYLPVNYTESPQELVSQINSLATDLSTDNDYYTSSRTTEVSDLENYELTKLTAPLLSPDVEKAGMRVFRLNEEMNATNEWFNWDKDTGIALNYHNQGGNGSQVDTPGNESRSNGFVNGGNEDKEIKLLSEETSHYRSRMLSKMPYLLVESQTRVIPGEAGEDYPTLSRPPKITKFTCKGDGRRYVADVTSGCQVFYMCVGDGPGEPMLCPNGTLFSQDFLVCDWWYNVDCHE